MEGLASLGGEDMKEFIVTQTNFGNGWYKQELFVDANSQEEAEDKLKRGEFDEGDIIDWDINPIDKKTINDIKETVYPELDTKESDEA